MILLESISESVQHGQNVSQRFTEYDLSCVDERPLFPVRDDVRSKKPIQEVIAKAPNVYIRLSILIGDGIHVESLGKWAKVLKILSLLICP